MSKPSNKRRPGRKAPAAPTANKTAPVQHRSKEKKKGDGDNNTEVKRLRYSHLLEGMIGCGDMVLLEPLTEENLLENLRMRYEAGEIYVSGILYSQAG